MCVKMTLRRRLKLQKAPGAAAKDKKNNYFSEKISARKETEPPGKEETKRLKTNKNSTNQIYFI